MTTNERIYKRIKKLTKMTDADFSELFEMQHRDSFKTSAARAKNLSIIVKIITLGLTPIDLWTTCKNCKTINPDSNAKKSPLRCENCGMDLFPDL